MSVKRENSPLSKEVIRQSFKRAIRIAVAKWGATAPNPSVGCVLLDKDGHFLVAAAHPYTGAPHAEIMALNEAKEKGLFERVYYAFVTLEPCAHYGRTPPCAEAFLNSPIQTIWIGTRDLNPVAAGGEKMLKNPPFPYQACEVFFADEDVALREIAQECQSLLAPFSSSILLGRPWITVKQALNSDGTMVPERGKKTFTSPSSLLLAHRLRRATDAIITGYGTVIKDKPLFTVRHIEDHHFPLEIGRKKKRLLLVGTKKEKSSLPSSWCEAREKEGFIVRIFSCLEEMLSIMRDYPIHWALIEAGPHFLQALKEASLWDEWLVIRQGQRGEEDSLSISAKNAHISPLSLLLKYNEEYSLEAGV